jgi:hypothetical protein
MLLKTATRKLKKNWDSSMSCYGPIADWWDAYVEAHEEHESINWLEFRATFHAHHVPQGVIKLKKNEF